MKRICWLLICFVLMVSLSGCYSEQKDELQTIIDIQIEAEETYTPISYSEYKEALDAAKAVKEKHLVTAGQIEKAKTNLEIAIESLYVKPDKTPLKDILDKAEQIDVSAYIPNTITTLNTAIEKSYEVYEDDNAVIEDIELSIEQLENGIEMLVVKPDKTYLINLLNKANSLDKNKYTTVSCGELEKAISSTKVVANNENATQSEVDEAQNNLQNTLDSMVRASKGVYRISCSLMRLSTNSVGNEWSSGITYNGESIHSGDTITAALNGTITITGTAIEHDSIPDSGSGSVSLSLPGGEKSTQFYVRENRGRYAGNLAIWELTCSATLVERI